MSAIYVKNLQNLEIVGIDKLNLFSFHHLTFGINIIPMHRGAGF